MDRLTRVLYGTNEPSVAWSGDPAGSGPPLETLQAAGAILGEQEALDAASLRRDSEWVLSIGRLIASLSAAPASSQIVMDGFHDHLESGLFVASRFVGELQGLGECDLKTQVVLTRDSEELLRCRLELAEFLPRGHGIGIRYFGTLVRRLREARFKEINLKAAGNRGSLYNGYFTWALFGADLQLSHDRVVAADQAGFPKVRTTHELFRHVGGARWWLENGETSEAVFDLAVDSRSSRLLQEYMMDKGVELS